MFFYLTSVKFVATRPKKVQKNDDEKKDTNPFKIAKDGRLIILDDESESSSDQIFIYNTLKCATV